MVQSAIGSGAVLRIVSRLMATPNRSVANATIQLVRTAKTIGITNIAVTMPIGASLCRKAARAMNGSGVSARAMAGIHSRSGMATPGARLRLDVGIGDLVHASHTARPTRMGERIAFEGVRVIRGIMNIVRTAAAMVTGIGDLRVISAARMAGTAKTSAMGLNACLGIERP